MVDLKQSKKIENSQNNCKWENVDMRSEKLHEVQRNCFNERVYLLSRICFLDIVMVYLTILKNVVNAISI